MNRYIIALFEALIVVGYKKNIRHKCEILNVVSNGIEKY